MDPNREVELKLELGPGDAARVLEHPLIRAAAAGPVEVRELHTVYFDSRDLALAQQGISLRLRRSNGRQWQTVKFGEESGAGLSSRGELEVELAGERPDPVAIPDEDLRARVVDTLAGQPLEPVFETEMKRIHQRLRDDVAEWSLDLDEGEVRAGFAREPIRELEFELQGGPASHLFEVALALSESLPLWPGTRSKAERGYALRTGERASATRAQPLALSPDATLKEAIVAIAGSCLAQISAHSALAFEGSDPEGVHQMRVGLRRMRALVTLIRRALPSSRLARLRTPLRSLGRLLGDVRDLDVFIEERLEPMLARRPDDPGLEQLMAEAIALRDERRVILREGLRAPRTVRLMLELGHWIAATGEQDIEAGDPSVALGRRADRFADAALARLHRKVMKDAGAALAGSPEARHALRIDLKKLRYACEFFRSLYDARDAKRYVRRLAGLQDLLGGLNDLETTRQLLQQLEGRGAPESSLALVRAAGFVEGFAVQKEDKRLRKLTAEWERFEAVRPFWDRE